MLGEGPLARLFFHIRSSAFLSPQQMPTNKQLRQNTVNGGRHQGLAKRASHWLYRSLMLKVSHQNQINC